MNRIIAVYGILSGLIVSANLFITCSLMQNRSSESTMMLVGFGAMLLAFTLMFIAVNNYRKSLPNRRISFGKAFKIAGLIAVICSLFYAFTWLIIYNFYYPEFLDDLAKMRTAGKSGAEILKLQAEHEKYRELYSHWWGILGSALMEILPIALPVALICAAVYSFIGKTRAENPV